MRRMLSNWKLTTLYSATWLASVATYSMPLSHVKLGTVLGYISGVTL